MARISGRGVKYCPAPDLVSWAFFCSLGALVGHLEKEQIGQLLDVIAVAHAVIPQNVAVVPEFLDNIC